MNRSLGKSSSLYIHLVVTRWLLFYIYLCSFLHSFFFQRDIFEFNGNWYDNYLKDLRFGRSMNYVTNDLKYFRNVGKKNAIDPNVESIIDDHIVAPPIEIVQNRQDVRVNVKDHHEVINHQRSLFQMLLFFKT